MRPAQHSQAGLWEGLESYSYVMLWAGLPLGGLSGEQGQWILEELTCFLPHLSLLAFFFFFPALHLPLRLGPLGGWFSITKLSVLWFLL